jgi:geranylgeranyl pyrophosphate synthase
MKPGAAKTPRIARMTLLDNDFPAWVAVRSAAVLDLARDHVARAATAEGQRDFMLRGLEAAKCARMPELYHASIHLPLLVHAAIAGDDAPAIPLAAACTLLWAGAELYDDLTDGDLGEAWREVPPFQVIFTATAIGAVMPPALVAALDVPWTRREGMLAELAGGLLRMFDGQSRDLALARGSDPGPAEVEASVVGKNGAPKAFFAGLAAWMAGASPERRKACMQYALALGVVYQLQSDHYELFFDPQCRDLRQGTRTLHVAFGLQALAGGEREAFVALLDRARDDEAARDAVRSRLRQADVIRPWAAVLNRHFAAAEAALAAMQPMDPAGRVLLELLRERSPRCT